MEGKTGKPGPKIEKDSSTLPLADVARLLRPNHLDVLVQNDPKGIERLADSLEQNGMKEPVIIQLGPDGRPRSLQDGAHRLAAARLRGWLDVPVRYMTWGGELIDHLPQKD